MADTLEDDRPPLDVTLVDRRRPGRMRSQNNAHLIALLRGQPTITAPATTELDDALPKVASADDLAPARGILIGLAISAAMWAMVISAI